MRGGNGVLVEDLAIGRVAAVEVVAIPGGVTDLGIVRIGFRNATFSRAVSPQLSLAASDQAMTSSRIVQTMPP